MNQRKIGRAAATRVGVGILALASTIALAHASIIPVLISGPTPNGPNFTYSYSANLQQDERLDPSATNGTTCQGSDGLVQCNPAGTFFTIYDIGGFVSAGTSASGWVPSIQFLGVTPSSIIATFDDPSMVNVTYFYTGPVVHADGTLDVITSFDIVSSIDGTVTGAFTSQATKDTGSSTGLTDQTVGPTDVPGTGSGVLGGPVPEPATFSLMAGAGLLLIGVRKVRTRKK